MGLEMYKAEWSSKYIKTYSSKYMAFVIFYEVLKYSCKYACW